ncbi:MAG: hypothetical protein ACREM1_15120, partial [Longimicrobiales bacterium]
MAHVRELFRPTAVAALLCCLAASATARGSGAAQEPGPPADAVIQVDFGQRVGEMTPIWAYFGYDESTFTYLPDGRNLLSELSELS